MTPLGEHLRKLRADRNISQKDMAAGIGVSAPYLSALEHGHRGKPSWDLLQRIIGYLNVIWDEAEILQAKWAVSDPRVVVDTTDCQALATEVANLLAIRVETLSEEELERLRSVLERER